jgi:hypothetical protein
LAKVLTSCRDGSAALIPAAATISTTAVSTAVAATAMAASVAAIMVGVAAVAIAEKAAIATISAAVASDSPLAAIPVHKPHQHQTGGKKHNDPVDHVGGGGHDGSRSEILAQTIAVRCSLAFRSGGCVTILCPLVVT